MLLPLSRGLCLSCDEKNCPQPPGGTAVGAAWHHEAHGFQRRICGRIVLSLLHSNQAEDSSDAVSSYNLSLFLVRSTLSGRWCSCTPASFCQGGRSID